MSSNNLNILTKEKGGPKTNGLPFLNAKNTVLGLSYTLDLIFVSAEESKKLNKIYRNKNKPANVLSFPIDKKMGHIFISKKTAQKEALKFDMSPTNFIFYLYIHGLLHIKGLDHGAKMDALEEKLLTKFKIKKLT